MSERSPEEVPWTTVMITVQVLQARSDHHGSFASTGHNMPASKQTLQGIVIQVEQIFIARIVQTSIKPFYCR
ncbi:hypothetical protein VTL71DRAFT_10082, partial [Oculimacula yallundae]